ncbi:hypothetical protein AAC387_Pa02g1407 [Persea americana]
MRRPGIVLPSNHLSFLSTAFIPVANAGPACWFTGAHRYPISASTVNCGGRLLDPPVPWPHTCRKMTGSAWRFRVRVGNKNNKEREFFHGAPLTCAESFGA